MAVLFGMKLPLLTFTVYRTTSPTAIITVKDKSVNIRIPQIYTALL